MEWRYKHGLFFPCQKLCSLPHEWRILQWEIKNFFSSSIFGSLLIWLLTVILLSLCLVHESERGKWMPFCLQSQCGKTPLTSCPNAAFSLWQGGEIWHSLHAGLITIRGGGLHWFSGLSSFLHISFIYKPHIGGSCLISKINKAIILIPIEYQ
jgi:hypothetical protein